VSALTSVTICRFSRRLFQFDLHRLSRVEIPAPAFRERRWSSEICTTWFATSNPEAEHSTPSHWHLIGEQYGRSLRNDCACDDFSFSRAVSYRLDLATVSERSVGSSSTPGGQ